LYADERRFAKAKTLISTDFKIYDITSFIVSSKIPNPFSKISSSINNGLSIRMQL